MVKGTKETKAQLRWKLLCMEACLVHNYHFSAATIDKASTDRMIGSGVILRLDTYNGSEIISPTMIKDGLSPNTLSALKADFVRSYDLATMFKPKGYTT